MEPTPLSSSAPRSEHKLADPEPLSRRRWWVSFLIGVMAVVLAGGAVVGGPHVWQAVLTRPGPLETGRAVVVPRGGTMQVAEALAANGIVRSPFVFRAAAALTRNQGVLHTAEFAFRPHVSIASVLAILRTGRPVEHHMTIAEGLTAQQISSLVANAEALSGDVQVVDEGSVLPETYDYEYGAGRNAILARARAAMDRELLAAWADRAPELPLSGPRDALILASIVERETAKPEERSHVAAVYLNRLRQGMKLQADPTVIYMASGGTGVLDHRLTRAELARDDPFNTYRNIGLPPAPICSPGLESLRAVLHPAVSDDLFFVADGAGGHVFSRNYEAHDLAVARWRSLAAPMPPQGRPE